MKKQIRIHLKHGSARVDFDCSQETIDALNHLSEKVYNMSAEDLAAIKKKNCHYCKGSGFDPYPNHDTTMRPCPECQ